MKYIFILIKKAVLNLLYFILTVFKFLYDFKPLYRTRKEFVSQMDRKDCKFYKSKRELEKILTYMAYTWTSDKMIEEKEKYWSKLNDNKYYEDFFRKIS